MTENRAVRRGLIQRLIPIAALVVVTLLSWEPWFFTVIAGERSLRVAALENASDGVDPAYVAFLASVAERVGRDEVIHLVIPPESVAPLYHWFVYRAEWTLAGYEIHPLYHPHDGRPLSPIERGDVVVLWNATPAPGSADVLMQEGRGTLARRR